MTTRPNLSRIMQKAWMSAKVAARRHGGSAREYVAEAMQQAWAEEKAMAARCNEMEQRVEAEVADILATIRAAKAARPVVPTRFRRAA